MLGQTCVWIGFPRAILGPDVLFALRNFAMHFEPEDMAWPVHSLYRNPRRVGQHTPGCPR